MTEEIKKEIKNTFYIDEYNMHFEVAEININTLFKILDKYKDKEKVKYIFTCKDCEEWYGVCPHSYREYDLEKYKNVYEELKKMYINGGFPNRVYERETKIQELEKKHEIEVE